MKKTLLYCGLLFSSTVAQATPISLEYQGFYQRLKQVNKGHYQLVEIAFSVQKSKECKVIDGQIATEKSTVPLTITKDQRLFIPYDSELKSERALVNLNVEGDATSCAISMQVRAKNTKQAYDKAELLQIQSEMNTLLSQMQGFPMRYFSSDIAGLNLEFDTEAVVTLNGKIIPVTGTYRLSRKALATLESLSLSQAPKVISPWTAAGG